MYQPDGSIVLVEIAGQRITRVSRDGAKTTLAEVKGGPNGIAVGPDGAFYLCNNGGSARSVGPRRVAVAGQVRPRPLLRRAHPARRTGRLDHRSVHECQGRPLRSPNDLVMDGRGGFYFTDHGIVDTHARTADLSAIYYARCDGSDVHEVAFPTHSPNGIGLSPDGTILYYAETYTGRIFRRRVTEPGVLELLAGPAVLDRFALLAGLPGMELLDSLAVDAEGWVSVGSLVAAASRRSRRTEPSSSTARPATRSPRTSASAATTSQPRTSRCPAPGAWSRPPGPAADCASPTSSAPTRRPVAVSSLVDRA